MHQVNTTVGMRSPTEQFPNRTIQPFPRTIHSLGSIQVALRQRREIQVVTFDLFDTLVQWTSNVHERHEHMWDAASRVLSSFNICISPSSFSEIRNSLWYQRERAAHSCGHEFQAVDVLEEIVRKVSVLAGKKLKSKVPREIARKLEAAFIKADADTIVPMPEARRVVSSLKAQGYRIAVISNHPFNPRSVENILRKCFLMPYIEAYFVSSVVGRIKSPNDPQCTIFKEALALFKVKPAEALHVGNEVEADFEAPRRLGMFAVICSNKNLLSRALPEICNPTYSENYKAAAVESFRTYSQLRCKGYYRQKRAVPSRDCERASLRLYELSRDYYAPLLIKFSEDNLAWLMQNPNSLNLCLGRDGLASFLVQRKIIELFPETYASVRPGSIRHLNISRELILTSGEDLIGEFLRRATFFEAESVTLIDNGIVGTIQNVIQRLYPGKNITGRYMLARNLLHDENRFKKKGFIVQTDCEWRNKHLVDLKITGGNAPSYLALSFLTPEFVHQQEDLWNGIYESPGQLVRENGVVRPLNHCRKIQQIPGELAQLRGLSAEGNYSVIKKLALRGIIEGVNLYRRQRELGLDYQAKDAIDNFAGWLSLVDKEDSDNALDGRMVRALARGIPAKSFANGPIEGGARDLSYPCYWSYRYF